MGNAAVTFADEEACLDCIKRFNSRPVFPGCSRVASAELFDNSRLMWKNKTNYLHFSWHSPTRSCPADDPPCVSHTPSTPSPGPSHNSPNLAPSQAADGKIASRIEKLARRRPVQTPSTLSFLAECEDRQRETLTDTLRPLSFSITAMMPRAGRPGTVASPEMQQVPAISRRPTSDEPPTHDDGLGELRQGSEIIPLASIAKTSGMSPIGPAKPLTAAEWRSFGPTDWTPLTAGLQNGLYWLRREKVALMQMRMLKAIWERWGGHNNRMNAPALVWPAANSGRASNSMEYPYQFPLCPLVTKSRQSSLQLTNAGSDDPPSPFSLNSLADRQEEMAERERDKSKDNALHALFGDGTTTNGTVPSHTAAEAGPTIRISNVLAAQAAPAASFVRAMAEGAASEVSRLSRQSSQRQWRSRSTNQGTGHVGRKKRGGRRGKRSLQQVKAPRASFLCPAD